MRGCMLSLPTGLPANLLWASTPAGSSLRRTDPRGEPCDRVDVSFDKCGGANI